MPNNRWLVWGALLVACVAVVWYRSTVYRSPPAPRTVDVMFVTGGPGPYWQLAAAGAAAAAEKHDVNLTVEMLETDESTNEQTQILSKLNIEDVQGLAISPLDAEGQTHLINRISTKVPLVTFDSDAPLSERHCYVGTSNYGAGEVSAELVREAISEGKIAVFQANLTKHNNIERKAGFDETIQSNDSSASNEPPRYSVVGYYLDEGDTERRKQNIRQVLQDYPDVKCLVGMNGFHGPILLDVLKEEGKLGDIKLVVFDAYPATLDGIAAGHIFATLAQDPYQYGYESIRMLRRLIVEQEKRPALGYGTLNFRAQPVRGDNLDEFRRRLEQRQQMIEAGGNSADSADSE